MGSFPRRYNDPKIPPPPTLTKLIVTTWFFVSYCENAQSCYNGKPKKISIDIQQSVGGCIHRQLKWLNFNFTKLRSQYSYYLFVDLLASINGSESSDVTAAGANCGEYLKLAKKGGGHDGKIDLWLCHISASTLK